MSGRSAWKVGLAIASAFGVAGMAQTPAPSAAPPSGQVASPSPGKSILPSFAPLVDAVKGSVINVEVVSTTPGGSPEDELQLPPGFEDLIPLPFGGHGQQAPRERHGLGSGVIIDPSGIALTNNHVVEDATAIQVRLDDGRRFDADVVGRDPDTDLAVIRIRGASGLPFARLGDSDAIKVGDWVVAIGNPFGLASSVSAGIISAKARNIEAGPYDDFLQTDAAINPGNSGGPLFNQQGEVVGINTAIVGGSATGIGFAVPSNMAKSLLPQMESSGHVSRGYLGLEVQDLSPELAQALKVPVKKGAVVVDITSDSPAGRAGVRRNDVITGINGKAVSSASELTRTVALERPGSTTTLQLYRAGSSQEVRVKLGERPGQKVAQATPKRGGELHEQLGLSVRDVNPGEIRGKNAPEQGALVVKVRAGSAADHAGLVPGMVVVEAAGKPVTSAEDLIARLNQAAPGSSVLLRVQVEGSQALVALVIPEKSSSPPPAARRSPPGR